jgi:alkylation response protein AidB-like acyl-CoA dehydrogenase
MGYRAPLTDIGFVLHHVLKVQDSDIPGYGDLDAGFTQAILEEAGKLCSDVLAPLNAVGDREGCQLENGKVRVPSGFQAAFDALRQGGWTAIDCDVDHGGQGLPYILHTAVNETFVSANMALQMYQGLTHGAYSALRVHGTEAQKAYYLPKLATCEWTGTMNLTEPQCGTDLGLIRTKAEPQEDGSYLITGTKIFISAGDHEMASNIIHLVLAKAPGGGEGTRGISLFVVPKYLEDGNRNAVAPGKVEDKMGIHGNATCVMNYDGARGWLVGDLHKGMRAMFTMMNEARLGVALQGYAVAEAAYQSSVVYARERIQGRGVTSGPGPSEALIVHPDVRRMLMDQKAFVEGARALTYWGAVMLDRAHRLGDRAAEGVVSLLIPVMKGFLTDMGFEGAVTAQQVWGGHGYIEDNGVSQLVRDARIAMIYEGANGVQALDLVGRKLTAEGGKPVMDFFDILKSECRAHDDRPEMAEFTGALKVASKQMQAAAMVFAERGMKNPNDALAGSTDFLHLAGHVCLGLMWVRMARAALEMGGSFGAAKLVTARHYMTRALPACALHLARIEAGGASVMALAAEDF